jgi:hypothetical protein
LKINNKKYRELIFSYPIMLSEKVPSSGHPVRCGALNILFFFFPLIDRLNISGKHGIFCYLFRGTQDPGLKLMISKQIFEDR